MPKPNRNFEKSKDFKGSMLRLFKSLDKWKYLLCFSLLLAMISAIIALIAPNKLSDLTDTITVGITPNISEEVIKDIMSDNTISMEDKMEFKNILSNIDSDDASGMISAIDKLPDSISKIIKPSINMDKVKDLSLLLAIFYIISTLFSYIEGYSMTTISNNYAKYLRSKISSKINKLPLKYFDTHETGDILSRITNDVDTVASNMNNSLATLVSSITLLVGSIIMMFVTNYIMAITAIVSSLIGFAFMGLILGKSQKYFIKRQQELGELNGYIEEVYSGHNVVKAYNGNKEAFEKFSKLNEKLYICNKKSQFLSGLMHPIMGFVGNLGYVCVCVVGAILTLNGITTFGVIVAFIIYVRLFTNPLSQIAQAMTSLQSTAASSERVFEFLDEKEMPSQEECTKHLDKSKVKGRIEFENVTFGYDAGRTIIKDFNAVALPGQKVAIVGPTGAGKTTMVNLLMKFYEINSGDIKIDGV